MLMIFLVHAICNKGFKGRKSRWTFNYKQTFANVYIFSNMRNIKVVQSIKKKKKKQYYVACLIKLTASFKIWKEEKKNRILQ